MPDLKAIGVGDLAPDFTLPSASGDLVTLADYRGKAAVVLFFYPRDNSPVCTAQACSFRDSFEEFKGHGAEVIGVSSDSEGSHRFFSRLWNLPFLLLSDTRGQVRARYGVARTLGLFPGRVTYLIDREGFVRHIVSSQFQPARHVQEMLARLEQLSPSDRTAAGPLSSTVSATGLRSIHDEGER
jgi:peroxiredoxin Q/BCP